jgi:hypothetical protein
MRHFKEHLVLRESVAAPHAEASIEAERNNAPLFEKEPDHRSMGVGGRQTLTTKTMSNTTQFSLANRKHLADMLADRYDGLRSKIKRQWSDKHDALYDGFLSESADKKGASPVLKQIDAAQRKLAELTLELKQLGFELREHDGALRLYDESSNPLDAVIEERIKKEIGSQRDIDARFDSAQVAMMTVATLQDAQQLLKSVQEV